jgi:outer membrane biosynthesis protein TonB
MARFSLMQAPSRWFVALKPAIAVGAALALLSVAASAASGSPNPSVWKERALTTVQEVTQTVPPSPTPEPPKALPIQPAPATQPEPSEAPEPNRESPEPSDEIRQQPSESPESSYIDGRQRYQSYPTSGETNQGGTDA